MKNKQTDIAHQNRIRKSRITSQREALLSVLREYDGHLDVYGLYIKAKTKEGRLSLSTVYRALKVFVNQGLVRRLNFNGMGTFYELARLVEHNHLLCLDCGRAVELNPVFGREEEMLLKQSSVKVLAIEITLKGYCPACREKREADQAEVPVA